MINMGMRADHRCVLCTVGSESVEHIFSECGYSKVVLRDGVLNGSWLEYLRGNFFSNASTSKARKLLAYLFLSVGIHALWRERNNRVHKSSPLKSSRQLRSHVLSMVRERLASSEWFVKKIKKDPLLILNL